MCTTVWSWWLLPPPRPVSIARLGRRICLTLPDLSSRSTVLAVRANALSGSGALRQPTSRPWLVVPSVRLVPRGVSLGSPRRSPGRRRTDERQRDCSNRNRRGVLGGASTAGSSCRCHRDYGTVMQASASHAAAESRAPLCPCVHTSMYRIVILLAH